MFSIALQGSIGSVTLWAAFAVFVAIMLALDLGVFNRRAHRIGYREAIVWSTVWIALALAFGAGIFVHFGKERGAEFIAGWLIEKALSVDNLFVFLVIFRTFGTPPEHQHRALFWGVIGAVVFRVALILAGLELLARFHFLVYVLGGVLIVTGAKLLFARDDATEEESGVVRFFRRWTKGGAASFLLLIAVIEVSDIIFALDSIPAVLAISKDDFVVITSNIFAILGLRSLFFLIAGALERVHYLKIGLAVVLIFVGAKMAAAEYVTVPIVVSLGVIVGILGLAVVASLLRKVPEEVDPAQCAPDPKTDA